jgi:pimeloyl-ACP methyl ester carboxylesterase
MYKSRITAAERQTSADFTLTRRAAVGRGALTCWLALPNDCAEDAIPLLAIHGIQRGARSQAELLGARAAALGRPVIAPLFDVERWPRYQRVVHKGRGDLALLSLMSELRLAGIWRTRRFELAGYSGGAQFAHRFAMLYPHLVSRLTVASAGWYTFPDDTPYPCGVGARAGHADDWAAQFAANLDRFLRLPIQVCVGAEDCLRDDNTRSNAEIDAQQGTDRKTRAARWVEALCVAAGARGIEPQVSFSVLPDCGHDFADCVRYGGLDRLVLPAGDGPQRIVTAAHPAAADLQAAMQQQQP